LWTHEWEKHGTCSNMTQLDYFNTSLHLLSQSNTSKCVNRRPDKFQCRFCFKHTPVDRFYPVKCI
jgi:ribonuclease I